MAKQSGEKINLLHVYDVLMMASANAFATISMGDVVNSKRGGDVSHEILKLAEQEAPDLIIMGTKGETNTR